MKNLSKSQDLSKNSMTEFDGIAQLSNADQITIDTLDGENQWSAANDGQKIRGLLEQKTMLAIEPYALAMLQENMDQNLPFQNIEQINSILQKITSQMPAQTTCYSRAGRTYLRISHEMGDIGNLFFKSLLLNILKDFGENYHLQTQENTVCAICRI